MYDEPEDYLLTEYIQQYNRYYPAFVHPATADALEKYARAGTLEQKIEEQRAAWNGTAERPLKWRTYQGYSEYAEDSLIGFGGFFTVPAFMPLLDHVSTSSTIFKDWDTTRFWDGSEIMWDGPGRYEKTIYPRKKDGMPRLPEVMPPSENDGTGVEQSASDGYDVTAYPSWADPCYVELWAKRWEWVEELNRLYGVGGIPTEFGQFYNTINAGLDLTRLVEEALEKWHHSKQSQTVLG